MDIQWLQNAMCVCLRVRDLPCDDCEIASVAEAFAACTGLMTFLHKCSFAALTRVLTLIQQCLIEREQQRAYICVVERIKELEGSLAVAHEHVQAAMADTTEYEPMVDTIADLDNTVRQVVRKGQTESANNSEKDDC